MLGFMLVRTSVLTLILFPFVSSKSNAEPACPAQDVNTHKGKVDDDVSLLQSWSGVTYGNNRYPQQLDLGGALPPQPSESVSLAEMAAGIEGELQSVQRRQTSSEVASLKKMVNDLQSVNKVQAGELHSAQEQQHRSDELITHSKVQLQRQVSDLQHLRQSEQHLQQSEQKAWLVASLQKEKLEHLSKELADRLQRSDALATKLANQRNQEMHQRALEIVTQSRKLSEEAAQRTKRAEALQKRDHAAYEMAVSRARQSDNKAKLERQAKEALLTAARSEISDIKSEVTKVQQQAAVQLQVEVDHANKAAQLKVAEANAELHKASGQLKHEHAEVTSVMKWAKSVQQQADAKVRWAAAAQEQGAAAQDAAATAAKSLEKMAQAQGLMPK